MKYDFKFTTWDIAKFYYDRDISLSEMARISDEIWNSRETYVETFIYDNKISFIKEIEKILDDMIFKGELIKENSDIKMIQDELDLVYEDFNLYYLKSNPGEEFLKQVRLRLDFEIERDFVYMKMRTLAKNYGYKRRNSSFIGQLKSDLNALDLYIAIREKKFYDIYDLMDIKLDDTIRIYSYGSFTF